MQLHRVRRVCFEASQSEETSLRCRDSCCSKKIEVGHAYSKIKCRSDPTDSLETHSIKVLHKTSVFKS